jgi:hypothetical protein
VLLGWPLRAEQKMEGYEFKWVVNVKCRDIVKPMMMLLDSGKVMSRWLPGAPSTCA